ncbi:sec1-family transport protein, partial [Thalassiosira pseudonana CCMP1335]
ESLPIDLIPLDDDVLSLELTGGSAMQLLSDKSESNKISNGESSDKKEFLNGTIGRVQGLGPLATAVIDRMMTLRMEEAQWSVPMPSIQALIVIDRKIDLVTPMLTPLTYEGLIDDVLQIQVGGCLQPPQPQLARDSLMGPTVLLPLNDSDPLYSEVRDRHVETFGSFLQNQAKALKESHSQFTNRETARDLSEIHQFVKQIPVFTRNLRSLTNHIHIAETVKRAAEAGSFRQRWQTERSMLESEPCYEVLEDLIAAGEPPYRWLRLLCLQSLTSNGIKATRYDSIRKEVVQTYGYEFLIVLNDLEKAGFLRKRETLWMDSMTTSYSTLRKALNLINAEVDPSNPEDAAYVSSGYAPMTVRWVQAAMRGYNGLEEAMKELPTAADAMKRSRGPSLGALAKSSTGSSDNKPVLLVYFVGGITYMEVAALRFLGKRPSFPYNIVCCATEIVNGETLLRSL